MVERGDEGAALLMRNGDDDRSRTVEAFETILQSLGGQGYVSEAVRRLHDVTHSAASSVRGPSLWCGIASSRGGTKLAGASHPQVTTLLIASRRGVTRT